jgi:RNA recognition motif-containing protein
MGRGNNTQAKRQREAERDRKKREKQERARERRADGGSGVAIGSVSDIQSAAFNERVEGVLADGTVLNGRENGMASSGQPCRLFVGGLSWDTSADDLRKTFETIGAVVDVVLVLDRDTGDSRGFGFVTMADRRAAAKAVRELSGFELDGKNIRIDIATERER